MELVKISNKEWVADGKLISLGTNYIGIIDILGREKTGRFFLFYYCIYSPIILRAKYMSPLSKILFI